MNDISAQSNRTYPIRNEPFKDAAERAVLSRRTGDLPGLTCSTWRCNSSYFFSFHIQEKLDFIEYMKNQGIVVSQVHARNDTHTVCAPFRTHLPNLDRVDKTFISIPVGWWVEGKQLQHCVSSIKAFCSNLSIPRAINQKKIIITGGCGFIGHHVVEHFAKTTDCNIVVIDKLSYASLGYDRLRDTGVFDRVQVFSTDLVQPIPDGMVYELGDDIEFIVHMAAETHVDNSIADAVSFIRNNIESTVSMVEYTRELQQRGCDLKAFFYFSTDEVFGPALGTTMFDEWIVTNQQTLTHLLNGCREHCISYQNT